VAQRAGVSVPTASRVLSGSSYPVVEELRLRVQRVAEELDYVPNAQAQGLLRGHTGTIGVLVGDVGDPYFSEIVNGIHERATAENLLVTICHTERDPARELGYFRMLQSHRAHSVILAGSGLTDESYRAGSAARVRAFRPSGGRVVALGTPVVDVARALVAHRDGGRMPGPHLVQPGHRDTALLARLRDHGRSVPGDISVAGFNDIDVSKDLSPALTTVRLPLREMGSSALDIALGPDRGVGDGAVSGAHGTVERQLGVELVVRESTGPVRTG